MNISELFTRRPVLSTVLGALILLLGFQGLFNLSIREYPEVEETVITINTVYPGASAELIQGFVTAPIASAVSTTENIDYVTSASRPSSSTVTVQMQLGADPDVALTEVMSKVQQVRGQLPSDSEDPVIVKGTGQQFAIMYLAFQNENMTAEQLTEYLERVIRPRMSTIEGVAEVQILGAANYAMRVWIDPIRLASRGVTASEVLQAINASNFLSAPGQTATNMSPIRSRSNRRCRRPRPSAPCPCDRMATRSCGCATSPMSSLQPRTPIRSSTSTAIRARSSASSRRRPPTRSTRQMPSSRNCRRSRRRCRTG